jgi:hypothetical protein
MLFVFVWWKIIIIIIVVVIIVIFHLKLWTTLGWFLSALKFASFNVLWNRPLSSHLRMRRVEIIVFHSVDMLKLVVSTCMEFSSRDSISNISRRINFFPVRETREEVMSFKFLLLNFLEQDHFSQSSSLSSSSFRAQEIFLFRPKIQFSPYNFKLQQSNLDNPN